MNIWIKIKELQSEELYEWRSSKLNTQLLQLRKESLKRNSNPLPLRYRSSTLQIKVMSQVGADRWIGSL